MTPVRSFLRRLFHDHRDDLIEELRSERDYLRSQLDTARAEVLALTNVHAYRVVHREVEDLAPNSPLPNVLQLRQTFTPEYTLEDKKRFFEEEDA